VKILFQYAALIIGLLGAVRAAEVDQPILAKIAVKSDGSIYFDDRKVEFRDLERLLMLIEGKPGVVWFRFTPLRGEGISVAAKDVMGLLNAKRISIRPYFRDDFPSWFGNGAWSQRPARN
jgi:hypothetical protein